MADALVIVDVQNDFCPGGALPVPNGDQVVPVLNQYMERAERAAIPIYAARDWHPERTVHFANQGGPWPVHCVQGTHGAQFHPDLKLPGEVEIVTKGTSGRDDGYSAFEGTLPNGQGLAQALRDQGVTRVYVGGLATDYCVRATTLGAREAGFDVVWLRDASKPVEVRPGDGERAERDMLAAGAHAETLAQFNPQK